MNDIESDIKDVHRINMRNIVELVFQQKIVSSEKNENKNYFSVPLMAL